MLTKMQITFAITLIAFVTSPVLAKNLDTQSAHAQQVQRGSKWHSPNLILDVFVNGKYVGSDPDAVIRHELRRDVGSD